MITATLKEDKYLIMYGNTSMTLTPLDFIIKDNGNLVIRGGNEIIAISNPPTSLCSLLGSGTGTVTITGYKHVKSTSPMDDGNNGHPNTPTEDMSPYTIITIETTISGSWGTVFVEQDMIYYPSVNPPNIDIARMRIVLRSSGSDYASLFQNSSINNYSVVIPDKIAPFAAGELIGYCPNAIGNWLLLSKPSGTINIPWHQSEIPLSFNVMRMGKVDMDIQSLSIVMPVGNNITVPINAFTTYAVQKRQFWSGVYSGRLRAILVQGYRDLDAFSFTVVKEPMPITFNNGVFTTVGNSIVYYTVNIPSTSSTPIDLYAQIRTTSQKDGVTFQGDWIPSGSGNMITVPANSNGTYVYTFTTNLTSPDYIIKVIEIRIGNILLESVYWNDSFGD